MCPSSFPVQAKQLAEAALLGCDTNRLRVTAFTLLGRCNHALGDFKAAQQNYAQVGAMMERAGLQRAGLGTMQMHARQQLAHSARPCLGIDMDMAWCCLVLPCVV